MIPQPALDLLHDTADTQVWPHETPPSHKELTQIASQMDGLLINIMDRIDSKLLDAAPRLRTISQMAAGLDNVDLASATQRKISIGYTPGVVSEATADQAFALLLSAARRLTQSERWLRNGNWEIAFHPLHWLGSEVNHSTLGIIGMGRIGFEMAKRARGFDMRILYHSRTLKPEAESLYGALYTDLPKLLSESDFISLHVPLTPETRHFIGHEEFLQMKPSAVLINAARGPVVDSAALYLALKDGIIAAAGLDVTDPEPIRPDDPLLTLNNVVIAPHLGSASLRTRTAMAIMAARNLIAGLQNQRLIHCANEQVYV